MAQPTHTKVRGIDAHRTQTKEFLKLIASVTSREGWREEQTLSHWLTATCCALRGPTLLFNPVKQEANEQRYMDVVKQCRHPMETMRELGNALAIITDALEAEMADVLTPIFTEVAASSQLAQFFTPYHLSYTMAKMLLSDAPVILEACRARGQRFITCQEPACGVGGMILAGNQVFREHGIDPSTQVHWVARDLDYRAVCGAYIQSTLTGASAVIEHGNTLSNEVHDRLHTVMAVMYPKYMRMDRAVEPEVKEAEVAAEQDAAPQFSFEFARESAA